MGARRDGPRAGQPRRSARLQESSTPAKSGQQTGGLKGGKIAIEDKGGVTKSKRQPKPRQQKQKYDCTTCGRTLAASSFPKYLPTDNCRHLINTCRSCLKQWLAFQVDNTTYDSIRCSECPEIVQKSDMKLHAATEIYKRFDDLERRGIADKTPGWRWCLAPRCRAGQVHHASVQTHDSIRGLGLLHRTMVRVKKSDGVVPALNICTCHRCGAKACVECDRPWHEGETCEEFQKRSESQNFAKEEAASEKTIQKESQPCPECKANIQRNGGCDAMRCKCGAHFCFLCLRPYSEIRQKGHAPECVYSQAGRMDPHMVMGAVGAAVGVFAGMVAGFFNGGMGGN